MFAKNVLQRYLCGMPDNETGPSSISLSGDRLKAIAHPLRVRLLQLLREDGPSTATRLGERIGESSGVTSYHLRQLAAHGFVGDDPGHAGGRERWWRALTNRTSLAAPDARASAADAETYMRAVAMQDAERTERWLDQLHRTPAEWDEAGTLSTYRLRLTRDQAVALVAQLEELSAGLRADDPDADGSDGTERVFLQYQVMPFIRDDRGES
jgi:DNA-binding transcriptional ArsR family regulator